MPKMPSRDKLIAKVQALGFHPITNHSDYGFVQVSAEHGDDAADYYGEFRGGYPWINPKLEKLAKEVGGYWEWVDPGSIALYEA